MFQGSPMGVSMKYQGCFMQVSWIGSFKGVSGKFQESFKDVLREFQGCFKEVLRCFEEVSRVFQESFKSVSPVIQESFIRPFKGDFKRVSMTF